LPLRLARFFAAPTGTTSITMPRAGCADAASGAGASRPPPRRPHLTRRLAARPPSIRSTGSRRR